MWVLLSIAVVRSAHEYCCGCCTSLTLFVLLQKNKTAEDVARDSRHPEVEAILRGERFNAPAQCVMDDKHRRRGCWIGDHVCSFHSYHHNGSVLMCVVFVYPVGAESALAVRGWYNALHLPFVPGSESTAPSLVAGPRKYGEYQHNY